ncbi:WEB family protein-like, chloroplastic [Iris pallida]|uniref:WEB family protein-like, chloroplastic n=1 Tax=Iris pallida TaxID=29817 RepID=A0AAX6ET97_IRIPA|nr:WEB family protein-like, chloroplastic [Iris pallida]
MLPSKPKSVSADTPNNKTPPPANKANRPGRAGATRSTSGSPSPLQSSRVSPKSVESKPAVERRSTRSSATPDRQAVRTTKGFELPAFQEDLKKAKEQLVSAQQEKAQALEELRDAKRSAEEANEKLKEGLAAQRREEEWQKELESVKKRHASDVEALLSTTRELDKLRQELELNAEAKNDALTQARDAAKAADANAEKVEFLSAEIGRLKSLLDSELDNGDSEAAETIRKLDSEVDALKQELETAKAVEDKLAVMEMLVERLSAEADDAKTAELDSRRLVDDWKTKAEGLEGRLAEAKRSERSALDSLALSKRELEDNNALLQASKSEISSLGGKVELLELKLGEADQSEKSSIETLALLMRQVEEASASLQDAEAEAAVYRGKVESLEIEVAEVKRAELDAVERAREWKSKAESIEARLVESKQQERSAMESLASVSKQLEGSNTSLEDAESEAASLRAKVKSLEIEVARCKHEQARRRTEKATAGNEEEDELIRELEMARDEEEKAKRAMEGLASALHEVSAEAREARERLFAKRVEFEDAHGQIEQLRSALRNTEENYEVMLDEARYEIVCLKKYIERFEMESNGSKAQPEEVRTVQGSEEEAATATATAEEDGVGSRARESELRTLQSEVDELSALLTEAAAAKNSGENGELSGSESDGVPVENVNGKPKGEGNGNGCRYLGEEEPVEVEVKLLEGYIAPEKYRNLSTDTGGEEEEEEEALDDDLDLKTESGSFDRTNGGLSVSPAKHDHHHMKKKKPLFQKFGSLLKKKNNHK